MNLFLPPMQGPGAEVLRDFLASDGDPRDLSSPQARVLRGVFEDTSGAGLWLFSRMICGLTKLTTHLHWEMCEFLSQWGKPEWERLLMMVPRGSFKTSLGSKAVPLWVATRDPEATIGIFNAAQDQAKSWVASIRQIVEGSHLYHELWPERLPPGVHWREREQGKSTPKAWKWGDSGLMFRRESHAVSEATFEPYGIGGSSTGKHYSHRVMDDLIGETAATSPVLIEDSIHFVDHARALERPPNGGFELVNCTPWAYRDCYSHMLVKWPEDYRVYRRSLLEHPETGEPDVVNGLSIFPEQITTEQAKKMNERDPFVFASQYQCIPMSGREVAFQREWIRGITIEHEKNEPVLVIPESVYDPKAVVSAVSDQEPPCRIPLHWCDRAILVDPAPHKKGEKSSEPRARNGIVVVAMDPWGRIYTLQAVPLREDPVTMMEAIVMMAVYWKVRKVGIEEVNFSSVYAPLWNAILSHRHPRVEFSWITLKTHNEDKDVRIRRTMAPHREGLWYYFEPRCGYVLQELMEFPNGETRDLIDAQAYVHQALSRPSTPEEREESWSASRDAGRDVYTGY